MTVHASWERVCPSCGAPFTGGEEFCPHDGTPLVASQKQPAVDKMLDQVLDNRFVLQKVLGVGGMGVVYLARHRMLERQFAVKLLRRELVGDELARRRFEREARIASSVMQHPNIVQIYDCGHTPEGRAYLVMEYVDGISLHSLANNAPNHQLHVSQTVDIVLQLAQALIAAHSRGIVHRDIKPENILITYRNGQADFVKVTDFGVARIVGEQRLTIDGAIVGTPAFIAPEMLSSGDVGPPADLYAVGIMMHELIAGSAPFSGNMNAILYSHLSNTPPLLSRRRLDVKIPQALDDLVARLLAKSPKERPTAEETADVLMELRPHLPPRSLRSLLMMETKILGTRGGNSSMHQAETLLLLADRSDLLRTLEFPLLGEVDQLEFEMDRSSQRLHRLTVALIRRRWTKQPPVEILRHYKALADSEKAEEDLGVRMALLRSEIERDTQQADERRAQIHAEIMATRELLSAPTPPRKTQQRALTTSMLALERAYADVVPSAEAERALSAERPRLYELRSEIQRRRRALAESVIKRCLQDTKLSPDATIKAACRSLEKALREFANLCDAMQVLLERLPTQPGA